MENLLETLSEGLPVLRVKNSKVLKPVVLKFDQNKFLNYKKKKNAEIFKCLSNRSNNLVNLSDLLEIRRGYNSDGLHRASKHYKFQKLAPESNCFSIVFKHPTFVCKSIDFVTTDVQKTQLWLDSLNSLMLQNSKNLITFDEKLWIVNNFREADLDKNGKVAFDELWKLFKKLNLQLSEEYVLAIFNKLTKKKQQNSLNINEFIELFYILTDLPEYRNVLRLANSAGEEFLDVNGVYNFLTQEQGFSKLEIKTVESIISISEMNINNAKLSFNGFRRLLQSRWGYILKEDHENVFQDMDQPLPHYFVNSSHNTYLVGSQLKGNATIEGYISALRKGARLLEYVFDGDHGEPVITHKNTFISPVSLLNVLKCIDQYAFKFNPYPVILTIENHASLLQQSIMAEFFIEIFGDKLYIFPPDLTEFPSPNKLKNKILLRGKSNATLLYNFYDFIETNSNENSKNKFSPSIYSTLSHLISLPSVKLSLNFYDEIKEHPINGSPSLSEGKVESYVEASVPIVSYTAKHFVKSYPSGIRQDSSNMNPIPSWLCGIQSVAMNVQTPDSEMDIVKGFFLINGNCGYVLKPKILLDGIDPRYQSNKIKTTLKLGIICGQYLPKPGPGKDIIDPFVIINILGIKADEQKVFTKIVKNNGFNPVWNQTFKFSLYCPELAIISFLVKDYDATSLSDFIGEFTIPISSVRQGYSHIRLNTGIEHSQDNAASLLVRIEFEEN